MKGLLGLKRAKTIVEKFRDTRVLVIGDLILDHFIWGRVRRISPEAPVPVVEVTSETVMLGGAANVVNNIRSLGGECAVTGVIGRDPDGRRLASELKKRGVSPDGLATDRRRPTIIKTRIVAASQQVVRFDREKKDRVSAEVSEKVTHYIKKAVKTADVVVISDYAKGLISEGLVAETLDFCAKRSVPVIVDPKVEHFDFYRGVTLVTPNNLEASMASGIEIEDEASLKRAGELLFSKLACTALLITRGEHGMSLFEKDSDTHIPTVAQEVFDVSGAGDTVISVIALALGSGATFKEAAVLANYAAGVVVGKVGTATLDKKELLEAVSTGIQAAKTGKAR